MKQDGQFILFTREEFKVWLDKQKVKRSIKLIQNHHMYLPNYKCFKPGIHISRLKTMKENMMHENGWSDIAQNLTTFPDGLIAVCRPFDVAPAGIKGANANGICIEHWGNFDIGKDKMTDEHRKTIVFLNAVLCAKFKLVPSADTIVYHHWYDLNTGKRITDKEIKTVTKTCPGTAFFGGNTVEAAKVGFIPLVAEFIKKG